MKWEKLGLIFQPDGDRDWMRSHAAVPTPVQLSGSLYRVYFSSRDADNRSHVGYFDIDLEEPTKIQYVSSTPVIVPGQLGFFDGQGVYAASAVKTDAGIYLYTIGWSRGDPSPLFYSSIGLAISRDDGRSFEKQGRAPIMARSEFDPCLVTSPVVLKDGDVWRMWYVSGIAWEYGRGDRTPQSVYHIKYGESQDGVHWVRRGLVCIDFEHPGERNISRTCVLPVVDGYEAWYGYACGADYRIGYARSQDGYTWKREDNRAGLHVSNAGWDSEAVAYPWVLLYQGKRFMLYNGNGFGRDGIGIAIEV